MMRKGECWLKTLSKEILVQFNPGSIELISAERERDGQPLPNRYGVIPLHDVNEAQEIAERLSTLWERAKLHSRDVTLVIGRHELLTRSERISETVLRKSGGYAAATLARTIPAQTEQLGEVAGVCIPSVDAMEGKVLCLTVGTRATVIDGYQQWLEQAGIRVQRVIPATAGTLRVLQTVAVAERHALGIRMEEAGTELLRVTPDQLTSVWVQDSGNDRNQYLVEIAEGLRQLLSAGEQFGVYIWGTGADRESRTQLATISGLALRQVEPWFAENILYYHHESGLRLAPTGYSALGILGTALLPGPFDMRTPRMVAVAMNRRNQWLRRRLWWASLGLGIAALLVVWGMFQQARHQVAALDREYAGVATQAGQLARINAQTVVNESNLAETGRALAAAPDWVEFLTQLQAALPDGLQIKTLKLDSVKESLITGSAKGNEAVAYFAKQLGKLPQVSKVTISYLRPVAAGARVDFGLTIMTVAIAGQRGRKE